MDDNELVEMVRDAIGKQRPYAGFFQWPQREIAEWGVANLFSEVAATEPGLPFRDIEPREPGEDPPDSEAIDAQGRRIAIEVTELVDGDAIAESRRTGANIMADWDASRIQSRLDDLIRGKDSKSLKGGDYDEYIVLIHSDEPLIPFDQARSAIEGHYFPSVSQIHRAYLILSYDPARRGYPYFRLL